MEELLIDKHNTNMCNIICLTTKGYAITHYILREQYLINKQVMRITSRECAIYQQIPPGMSASCYSWSRSKLL